MITAATASLLILVNGPPGSAAAERARRLSECSALIESGRLRVTIAHRPPGKLTSVAHFLSCVLRIRPTLIWVVDMAAAGVIAGVAYRLLARRSRLVIDSGDAIVALGRKIGRGRLGLLATACLECVGQSTADQLIVRGSQHPRYLERCTSKTVVIQDGADVSAYAGVPPIEGGFFTAADPMVVGILGSLEWNSTLRWCYGVELVEALHALPVGLPVRGVIIGDGSGLTRLREMVQRYALDDRVAFIPRLPAAEVPDALAKIHVALSTQTNDVVGQVRTTGKLPLYLAAGRFVLASDVGEASIVLPSTMRVRYDGAFDAAYPLRLAKRIAHLADDRTCVALGSSAAREIARRFDYAALAARLDAEVLAPLLAG